MNGKGYSLYPYQYHIPWVHATKRYSNDVMSSRFWHTKPVKVKL